MACERVKPTYKDTSRLPDFFLEFMTFEDGTREVVPKRRYGITTPLCVIYAGWNFNSGNYLFTTDTK